MARKKSLKGRSRKPTVNSRLNRVLVQTNIKLRSLENAGMYGQYSFKKLLRHIEDISEISYKKKRRNKFVLKQTPRNMASIRLLLKNFQSFVRSKTSSPIGVKNVREQSRKTLKKTLSNITDKDITARDADEFYSLFYDDDFNYFAEKIPPSDLYVLIQEAKSGNYSEEDFIKTLERYIMSNNEEVRIRASRLYHKFVR